MDSHGVTWSGRALARQIPVTVWSTRVPVVVLLQRVPYSYNKGPAESQLEELLAEVTPHVPRSVLTPGKALLHAGPWR